MRFKKFTFSWLSPLVGFHYGRNPVSNTRFLHVAPVPFFGVDFYWPEDQMRAIAQLGQKLPPGTYIGKITEVDVHADGTMTQSIQLDNEGGTSVVTNTIKPLPEDKIIQLEEDDDC